MQELLESSIGFPKGEFSAGSTRMHILKQGTGTLHGCYWIEGTDELKTLLSPSPKVTIGSSKPLKLFYEHPKKKLIGVPKFFGQSAFGIPQKDLRVDGLDISTSWNEDFKLRYEQELGIEKTMKTLEEWGGAFYVADCGFGKSVVIASFIHRIKKRTMVVVPRLTLIEQTFSDLGGKQLNDRKQILSGASIQILQGSFKHELDADIIVASLDSLSLFKYPESFWNSIGLVIFDEAHHMAAKTLSAILPHVVSKRIIGFSATPNRTDGLEHVLYWLIGPVSFIYQRLPIITGKRDTVIVRRVEGVPIEDEFMWGGKLNFSAMVNAIAADENRNKRLIEIAMLYQDRGKILLITAFREHCDILGSMLPDAQILHGGRKRKLSEGKYLVATYGMLEEGFDDADLDTLILCTPRSTVQQTIGRIERTKEGKKVPLVIDVVDKNRIFEAMWFKRKKFYKSRGFNIGIEEKGGGGGGAGEGAGEAWVDNSENFEFE